MHETDWLKYAKSVTAIISYAQKPPIIVVQMFTKVIGVRFLLVLLVLVVLVVAVCATTSLLVWVVNYEQAFEIMFEGCLLSALFLV